MNTNEVLRLALEALEQAHDESLDENHFECRQILMGQITALRAALMEQPAQQPAQQQEPQTSAQEKAEFEQFWVDELGEADELTYGKLGYAIRRVDVAWEAWKAGKISANQQTIMGRKVWVDWKAQTLELRELVRLNGLKIAELEAAQPALQEPVATITITQRGSTRTIDNHFEDCVRTWPNGEYKLYTGHLPAQRKPLADEVIGRAFHAFHAHYALLPRKQAFKAGVRFAEAAHGIK